MSEWPCLGLEATSTARLQRGRQWLTPKLPQIPCSRMQLQILAVFASLSGISFPSRVQLMISIAQLANLDLVRSAAPCTKTHDADLETDRWVLVWFRFRVFSEWIASHARASTTTQTTLPSSACQLPSCSTF